MRVHHTVFVAATLTAFASSGAAAEARWSGAAHSGLVFTTQGVSSGGWIDVLHAVAPNWSAGCEAGYVALPQEFRVTRAFAFAPLYVEPTGEELRMFNASGVVRGHSAGPLRVHLLASFGYYDLATRTRYTNGLDRVEHDAYPGFGLGLGLSGTGLVRPGFQLRWDQVIRPHNDYLDAVSFAAGLHIN